MYDGVLIDNPHADNSVTEDTNTDVLMASTNAPQSLQDTSNDVLIENMNTTSPDEPNQQDSTVTATAGDVKEDRNVNATNNLPQSTNDVPAPVGGNQSVSDLEQEPAANSLTSLGQAAVGHNVVQVFIETTTTDKNIFEFDEATANRTSVDPNTADSSTLDAVEHHIIQDSASIDEFDEATADFNESAFVSEDPNTADSSSQTVVEHHIVQASVETASIDKNIFEFDADEDAESDKDESYTIEVYI